MALEGIQTLGPYTLVRQLGAGAFGAVFEARKEPLGKRIALKFLLPDKAANAQYNARFVLEARAAASLRHPHIVDVDDVGVLDGVPFLAMEFLEGETLTDRLKREGPMSPQAALDVMLPVLSAVAAVHDRGIVHRDLKPDNVFLWRPSPGIVHPKLLDFGIAKVRDGFEGADLTQSGAIMGTPRYMSPEQWGGSKYASPASDQWSLAVMVFHCLSGRLPFEASELPALMMRVTTEPPASLRGFIPALPEALERVVLHGLARDPARRHASVRAFAHALLPFASPAARGRWSAEFGDEATLDRAGSELVAPAIAATLDAGPPPVPDTLDASSKRVAQTPPATKPWWPWVAAAVAGVVLIAAGVVAVTRPSGEQRAAAAPTATPTPPPMNAALPAPPVAPVAPPAPVPPTVQAPAGPVDAGVDVSRSVRPSRPHSNRPARHRTPVI